MLLCFIIVTGLCVRTGYLFILSAEPAFEVYYAGLDAALYDFLARQVACGNLLLAPHAYYYSPLYAYFLGALYALFTDSHIVVRLANIALGTGTIALVFFYSRRFFKLNTTAYIAAAGASLYGPFIVFDTSCLKTSLGMFLIACSLLLLSGATSRSKLFYFFITGMVLGLAGNIYGQMFVFAAALCCMLLIEKNCSGMSGRTGRTAMLACGLLCSVGPCLLRNVYVVHDPIPTTVTGGVHAYIGNHDGAWGGYSAVEEIRPNPAGHYFDAERVAERKTGKALKPNEVSSFWRKQAYEWIAENPRRFLSLVLKKIRLISCAYEIPNNENYQYLVSAYPYLSCFLNAGLLFPFGITGLLIALFRDRRILLFAAFCISFAVGMIATFVTWRYRLPIVLVLLPCASCLLVKSVHWMRTKKIVPLFLCFLSVSALWWGGQSFPGIKHYYDQHMREAERKMRMCRQELRVRSQLDTPLPEKKQMFLWLSLARIRSSQHDIEGAIGVLTKEMPQKYTLNVRVKRELSHLFWMLGHYRSANIIKSD